MTNKLVTCLLTTTLLTANLASAMEQSKPAIVFVKEYCTYAKNFKYDDSPVAAIDISSCYLLEIANRDEQNKRTAFSLTHFTSEALLYASGEVLQKSIKQVLAAFLQQGGDIETAKIRILGGSHDETKRNLARKFLKHDLKMAICPTDFELVIDEPKNHYSAGNGLAIDYVFFPDRLEFQKIKDMDDQSKDVYSPNLDNAEKKQLFRTALDSAYKPVSSSLDDQTWTMNRSLDTIVAEINNCKDMDKKRKLQLKFLINVVQKDGLIKK